MSEPSQQKYTLVALVENKPGVLNRIASLFRRRNFNIDSLTVGRTHKPHVSRMTIVVDAQQVNVALIAANLRKLVNVIEVRLVSDMPHVSRDLALIKVRSNNAESANAITSICERYPARIVDIRGRCTRKMWDTGILSVAQSHISLNAPISYSARFAVGRYGSYSRQSTPNNQHIEPASLFLSLSPWVPLRTSKTCLRQARERARPPRPFCCPLPESHRQQPGTRSHGL
jgi:acetolactate synthase small subunit